MLQAKIVFYSSLVLGVHNTWFFVLHFITKLCVHYLVRVVCIEMISSPIKVLRKRPKIIKYYFPQLFTVSAGWSCMSSEFIKSSHWIVSISTERQKLACPNCKMFLSRKTAKFGSYLSWEDNRTFWSDIESLW